MGCLCDLVLKMTNILFSPYIYIFFLATSYACYFFGITIETRISVGSEILSFRANRRDDFFLSCYLALHFSFSFT